MRTPSTFKQLYAWHSAAVERRAGVPVLDHRYCEGEAHCGWYRRRMVKDGPFVPVEIICERELDPETGELADDERLVALVGPERERRQPYDMFTHLTAISHAEFKALLCRCEADPRMAATHLPFTQEEHHA
ncbi:MAG: hypothetical protein AAFQ51_05370 [Pseudomonadota bacterium]